MIDCIFRCMASVKPRRSSAGVRAVVKLLDASDKNSASGDRGLGQTGVVIVGTTDTTVLFWFRRQEHEIQDFKPV